MSVEDMCVMMDLVFESMPINTSIVVCKDGSSQQDGSGSSQQDGSGYVQQDVLESLQQRSYPCILLNEDILNDLYTLPNRTIVCSSYDFNSPWFKDIMSDIEVDCLFFIGADTFSRCVGNVSEIGKQEKQFIFTI